MRVRASLPPPGRPDRGALRRGHRQLPELLALAWTSCSRRRRRSTPDASFPDGGYFVQRSGWDAGDASFGIFDCGPLGDGGHGHYDLLSVELFAGGRPLLVDPGRGFTYSEEPPNLRRWFRGTAAHNTVCVDGLDQTPYTRTRPVGTGSRGAASSAAHTRRAATRSPARRAARAYDAVHKRQVDARRRRALGHRGPAGRATPHRYDLRFHLAPEAHDATRVEGATVLAPDWRCTSQALSASCSNPAGSPRATASTSPRPS